MNGTYTIVLFEKKPSGQKAKHAEMRILDYIAPFLLTGGILGVCRLFCLQCKCCIESVRQSKSSFPLPLGSQNKTHGASFMATIPDFMKDPELQATALNMFNRAAALNDTWYGPESLIKAKKFEEIYQHWTSPKAKQKNQVYLVSQYQLNSFALNQAVSETIALGEASVSTEEEKEAAQENAVEVIKSFVIETLREAKEQMLFMRYENNTESTIELSTRELIQDLNEDHLEKAKSKFRTLFSLSNSFVYKGLTKFEPIKTKINEAYNRFTNNAG